MTRLQRLRVYLSLRRWRKWKRRGILADKMANFYADDYTKIRKMYEDIQERKNGN